MKGFVLASFLSCLLSCQLSAAQTFKTENIKKAARILGILDSLDCVDLGQTQTIKAKDGQIIEVRKSKHNVIEHIGIPLFNNQMRTLMPSPVYDFLEFAVLNIKYKVNPNTLYLSKVIFKKGNWNTLMNSQLIQSDCSIVNQDDRLYIVNWKLDEKDIATIGIPIEYELLNNDNRRNIEKSYILQLKSCSAKSNNDKYSDISEENLKIYGTEGLFVIEGDSHILPELNQNVYYVFKTIYEKTDTVKNNKRMDVYLEAVIPTLLIDKEHPAESFANLMLGNDPDIPDVKLVMDFHLSDYHRQQVAIPLRQLKTFCEDQGDQIFFASSGIVKGIARGMLFIHNSAKGYNHLLSISIPLDQMTSPQPVVKAAVYLFIPPIEKSHLYGNIPTKKSGAKIY